MSRKNFGNSKRDNYLNAKDIEKNEAEEKRKFDHKENNISSRIKFNFSYFQPETPGYDFSNLSNEKICNLINKIKEYSKEPLIYWESQGSYAKYDSFPERSGFFYPENVPLGVSWGRFRIGRLERLVGFTIPQNRHGEARQIGGKTYYLDYNTIYIVFLDMDHKFYLTSRKGK